MDGTVRVVVLGTGQMGSGIIKLLLHKQGIDLVGVYGRRAQRVGMDVGRALGLERDLGLQITHDLPGLLARTQPQVVMQATRLRLVEAVDEITTILDSGANMISIAEEMAYPAYQAPHIAAAIHQRAIANKVTVVGTGINPGFVLDLLVIALTGVCYTVESITAQRINDLSPYGPSVLRRQGVGLTPEAFDRGVAEGSVRFPVALEIMYYVSQHISHYCSMTTGKRISRQCPLAPGLAMGIPCIQSRPR